MIVPQPVSYGTFPGRPATVVSGHREEVASNDGSRKIYSEKASIVGASCGGKRLQRGRRRT